jgi:uncharacterized protein YjbJ (UPF0337 family)
MVVRYRTDPFAVPFYSQEDADVANLMEMHMNADRIRHNLRQVVDRTKDQWGDSVDDDDLTMVALGGRRAVPNKHQRQVDERGSDVGAWRGKDGKESDRRSRRSRASHDLDPT